MSDPDFAEVTPQEYALGLIRRALDSGAGVDVAHVSRLSGLTVEQVSELVRNVVESHTRDLPATSPVRQMKTARKPAKMSAAPPPLIGGGEYESALLEVCATLDLLQAVETDPDYKMGLAKARAAVQYLCDALAT